RPGPGPDATTVAALGRPCRPALPRRARADHGRRRPRPARQGRPLGRRADALRGGLVQDRAIALVALALVGKSVLVAAALLEQDRWAALVALSALPLAALLVCPALLLRGRGRTAYLVGVDLVVSTLLLADLLNARAFG